VADCDGVATAALTSKKFVKGVCKYTVTRIAAEGCVPSTSQITRP
jgi:hypothetical protein